MKSDEDVDCFVRHLSGDESEVLRYFYDKYHKDGQVLHVEWPRISKRGDDPDAFHRAYSKFNDFGLFRHGSNEDDYITDLIDPVFHRIENPPLPNHWDSLLKWWFSKKWSLPVTCIIVVVPILTGWAKAVAWLVGCFTRP